MIKYSLQNECLENIEAFTDEQISREMAVIESVLEIYNKTILMMELSNSDVDLPDCSMFMESTFFQESDGDAPNADNTDSAPSDTEEKSTQPAKNNAQGESDEVEDDGNDENTSGGTKKSMTEEERKAYNNENWYRQINKKGNVENIFISIIAFIPRFFMFLYRVAKKLSSKTNDESKDAAVKNADAAMQNMTPNQISNAVDSVRDSAKSQQPQPQQPEQPQPQSTPKEGADTSNIGEIDFNSRTWKWYNTDNVLAGIRECMKTLTDILNNIDSYMNKQTSELKTQINNCQTIIENTMTKDNVVKMRGADLVASKDAIKAELGKLGTLCENLAKTFENRKNKFFEAFKISTDKSAKIDAVKQSCIALKGFSQETSKMLDNAHKYFENAVREANAINNAAGKNDQTNAQQTQQQQSVSTEGG